jgi:DNA-binding XRE family transcriptional regulator
MPNKLIQRLKIVREKNKKSQEDMAHLIGVSVRTYQRWEAGEFNPSRLAIKNIHKVIKLLNGS